MSPPRYPFVLILSLQLLAGPCAPVQPFFGCAGWSASAAPTPGLARNADASSISQTPSLQDLNRSPIHRRSAFPEDDEDASAHHRAADAELPFSFVFNSTDPVTSILLEPRFVHSKFLLADFWPQSWHRPLVCPRAMQGVCPAGGEMPELLPETTSACPGTGPGICPDFQTCGVVTKDQVQAARQRTMELETFRARDFRATEGGYDLRHVSACVTPGWSVGAEWIGGALNCPIVNSTCNPNWDPCFQTSERDKACSHGDDTFVNPAWTAAIFKVQNQYINMNGQMFNDGMLISRGGCRHNLDFEQPAGTPVVSFETLINLAHGSPDNYYHSVIEILPMLYLALKVPEFRGLPVLTNGNGLRMLQHILKSFMNATAHELQVHTLGFDNVAFAKTVVVPNFQTCFRPSRGVWSHLRSQHLLPPDGLPMLNPDHTPREVSRPVESTEPWPSDWVVVLQQRLGMRKLTEHEEVLELLRKTFPPERVVVSTGSESVVEAKELYNRAVFMTGPHGAGYTNMIFMPRGAAVLELRPQKRWVQCFSQLAHACELSYYLTLCPVGEYLEDISCRMEDISSVLTEHVIPMMKRHVHF